MWPSMALKVKLHLIKDLGICNVSIHAYKVSIRSDFKGKIYLIKVYFHLMWPSMNFESQYHTSSKSLNFLWDVEELMFLI